MAELSHQSVDRPIEREAVELARDYCTQDGDTRPCGACIERARRLLAGCVDQPAPDRGAVEERDALRLKLSAAEAFLDPGSTRTDADARADALAALRGRSDV
jgi:hypothetical protein